jgi:hypothetical protein
VSHGSTFPPGLHRLFIDDESVSLNTPTVNAESPPPLVAC